MGKHCKHTGGCRLFNLAARFGTEECAVEDDLTDAQAAALSTMAAAFNQTCSDVLGEFKGKASACDCE